MEWVTSSSLLRDLRTVDDGAGWERFVHRFRPPLVRFARRLGVSPDGAEDIAQDALLAFAESVRSGQYDRSRGRLSTWLFGIAARHVLRARRRLARGPVTVARRTETSTFWSALPAAPESSDAWHRAWEREMLVTCLERVRQEVRPATYRAFEMVVVEGRPAADAAAELGVAMTAIYNAKHRVIQRVRELREELDDDASCASRD